MTANELVLHLQGLIAADRTVADTAVFVTINGINWHVDQADVSLKPEGDHPVNRQQHVAIYPRYPALVAPILR